MLKKNHTSKTNVHEPSSPRMHVLPVLPHATTHHQLPPAARCLLCAADENVPSSSSPLLSLPSSSSCILFFLPASSTPSSSPSSYLKHRFILVYHVLVHQYCSVHTRPTNNQSGLGTENNIPWL